MLLNTLQSHGGPILQVGTLRLREGSAKRAPVLVAREWQSGLEPRSVWLPSFAAEPEHGAWGDSAEAEKCNLYHHLVPAEN